MSLKGFLRAAGIVAFIFALIGFTIGWWAAPTGNTPADLTGINSEIAGLKLAMESGQGTAAKVAVLEKQLAEAQAAQKVAEATAKAALERLEKIPLVETPEGFELPKGYKALGLIPE